MSWMMAGIAGVGRQTAACPAAAPQRCSCVLCKCCIVDALVMAVIAGHASAMMAAAFAALALTTEEHSAEALLRCMLWVAVTGRLLKVII